VDKVRINGWFAGTRWSYGCRVDSLALMDAWSTGQETYTVVELAARDGGRPSRQPKAMERIQASRLGIV